MTKEFVVNPFNVFEIRKTEFLPTHFENVTLKLNYNMFSALEKWIEKNSKGRYYVGKSLALNEENKVSNVIKIGFENPSELSYFMLACPHLNYV